MDADVLDHLAVLRERVFQTETLWPQFRLLLDDLVQMAQAAEPDHVVVSLERTLLYGGCSLIAPLFTRGEFISIDCSPPSADERGSYNSSMVDDRRFVHIPTTRRASIYSTGLPDESADLVLVPNLVHHIADQARLFGEMARVVRPGGRVYVFEALVREIHQAPDDYLRYTPHGLEIAFRAAGLEPEPVRTEGGPFQVITYCWTQALQYLPEEERRQYEAWFRDKHFPELMELDARFSRNLVKDHSSFPMSFSMMAVKPPVA
jgi:SAM-dependent methyltransferase